MKELVYVIATKRHDGASPKATKIIRDKFYHCFEEAQEAIDKMKEVYIQPEKIFGVFTATIEVLKEITEVVEEEIEEDAEV